VLLDQVKTHFVQVAVGRLSLGRAEAIALLAQEGVGLSATIHPGVLRAVTHLDVSDGDVDVALTAVPRGLLERRAAA
jgi:hypothetical protein